MSQPSKKPKFKQAKIVTIYNQKGGCGKTMLTMQLGGTLAEMGYRTLVMDLDPQGTAYEWASQADEEDPFPAEVVWIKNLGLPDTAKDHEYAAKVTEFLAQVHTDYDFILLDCPPAIGSTIPQAVLRLSDVGLIPVIPVFDNYWASKPAKRMGLEIKQENPALKLFYVPSAVRRGRLFSACMGFLKNDDDIACLGKGLTQRNIFPECQIDGTTVHYMPRGQQAIDEVNELATGFLKVFGIKVKA